MTQLILGAAYGYKTDLLLPFVKSLRRHYSGQVILLSHAPDEQEQVFYKEYNIDVVAPSDPVQNPKDIQVLRYFFYRQLLESHQDKTQILITDVRDVVFQDNPFKQQLTAELEFFEEPALFKNCTANAPWIAGIYGQQGLDLVADKHVLCSGTTMGTHVGMIKYIDTMLEEIQRIWATGRPLYQGEDQPVHNYLVYSNRFDNYTTHANGIGPITTIHHQQSLTFNRRGQLLNQDGSATPVIHQWDRAGPTKAIIEQVALNGPAH